MQISLICAVLLVAVSSVLAYDVDLWAEKRAEGRLADKRARKIQELKELVKDLEAMEQNKGLLGIVGGLGKCVKLDTVTDTLDGLTDCFNLGKRSSRFDIMNRGLPLPLPIPIDVGATLECLTGEGGSLNLEGVLSTVTGLVGCVLGTVKAGVPLKDLTGCVNNLVSADVSGLVKCVNKFIGDLTELNIPDLPLPPLISLK